MENKRTVYQLRVVRNRNIYSILTRQGIRIADFLMPMDKQLIRDNTAVREIMNILEWRFGLRKEKINGNKSSRSTHDLFYYQVSINGYYVYIGNPEEGHVSLIARVACPNDGRYDMDQLTLNEILQILDKRVYWK